MFFKVIAIATLLLTLQLEAHSAEGVTFKFINGILSYDSEYLSGSSTTILSPSITFHKDFSQKHQVGIGLDAFLSLSTSSVSLYGLGVGYKYFFSGSSSSTTLLNNKDTVEYKNKLSYFIGADFKRYTYFLGSNKVDEDRFEQTGNFFNLDATFGGTYSNSLRSRYLLEVSRTLAAFASSDDRVKYKGFYLSIGYSKDFE